MNVLNYRVDDRLVHGCVATMWIPTLGIERVLCIDDESANNQILKDALRMGTPKSTFLSVLTTEKAIDNLKVDKYGNQKLMVVVKNPKVILDLLDAGISVPSLTMGNLGNITKTADSCVISRYITVNDEDYEVLKKINNYDVKLEARLQPKDAPIEDFFNVIQSKKEKGDK